MNKVDLYGYVKEEQPVVMIFSKIHEQLGFPKLTPASKTGFDIDDIEYKGRRVTVEFEFVSSNYINHGHVEKMREGRDYVLVCYEDDCNIIEKVRNLYHKKNLELIELKDYVNIKEDKIVEGNNNIQYILLSYNQTFNENISICEWKNKNIYGLNTKFASDYIVPGSKILFKSGDYIVAKCDVVKYEKVSKPQTELEVQLSRMLHNYPLGVFNMTDEEIKEFDCKGYILYDEFKVFERPVNFKEVLPEKNLGNDGRCYLTKGEYDLLSGN